MPKEFRLTVTVPLPADKFAEAKQIFDIERPLQIFLDSLPDAAVAEHDIVTPRTKKGPETSAPTLRLHGGHSAAE